MRYVRRFLQLRLSASSNRLSTTRIIALCFAGIILTGALLLTLPVASRSGESCGFLTALFTATSATCVTGLILVDTFVQWSGFGQLVILSQAMSLNDVEGVVRLQKHVLVGTFSLEGLGALILFFRFLPGYGPWNALKWGVFHSVSAFCNAGFDILGVLKPGSSLMLFQMCSGRCVPAAFAGCRCTPGWF